MIFRRGQSAISRKRTPQDSPWFIEPWATLGHTAHRGDLVLGYSRATPETEKETTEAMLQPIYNKDYGLALIHNGSVTESCRQDYPWLYNTEIDSEIILAAYIGCDRNMKKAMEKLSGAFAFVLVDFEKGCMYAVASFNPLAHAYIKGVGYFLHSTEEALRKVVKTECGASRDGMNVWENWYCHYLPGYTIVKTDLDSGMQQWQEFQPRFILPDPPMKEEEDDVVLVAASGGIDSGLTSWVLAELGYNVNMVNFLYGQRSEEAEQICLEALSNCHRNFSLIRKCLSEFYHSESSMLMDRTAEILTGGDLIKSTIAWVPGRNAFFAVALMVLAEQYIMMTGTKRNVYISAGWNQLSEETGGYPDNSFRFNRALEELVKYGFVKGGQIKMLPVLQRLTKTEEWRLGAWMDFPFEYTVSCDNPKVVDGNVVLCTECGSTKLSMIAAERAGVADPRLLDKPKETISEYQHSYDGARELVSRLVLPKREDYQNLTASIESGGLYD